MFQVDKGSDKHWRRPADSVLKALLGPRWFEFYQDIMSNIEPASKNHENSRHNVSTWLSLH